MSETTDFLKSIEMFIGLSDEELAKVADLCQPASFEAGSLILEKSSPADKVYLIQEGTVEIITDPEALEAKPSLADALIVTLGRGQSFGEMGLVDSGVRSATVRAGTLTRVMTMACEEFRELCEQDNHLGYMVMRNIAADLSFKLRYRNLI
ncbi:MAG: cyclic nucleotide-binding domain-containing protein [Anaerolineae bacterium]